jgi:WD40 repeat protein
VAAGKEIATLKGHTDEVSVVAFSPGGKTLASGCLDGNIKLWDVATGKELATLERGGGKVRSVSFSPNGKMLASGNEDGTIGVWDVATDRRPAIFRRPAGIAFLKPLDTLREHTGSVKSVTYSPDGKTLISGGADRTIKLWHIETTDLSLVRTMRPKSRDD